MSRHWQEILQELHSETHRDGYYCRKTSLDSIVDELINEMYYAHELLAGAVPHYNQWLNNWRCTLPEAATPTIPNEPDKEER